MRYAVFNEPDGGSIRSAYEAVRFRQGIYGIWKKSGKLENEASVGLMTRSKGLGHRSGYIPKCITDEMQMVNPVDFIKRLGCE